MIRILVLTLVAVNLLYFGWTHWVTRDARQLTAVAATPRKPKPVVAPAPVAPPLCATLGPFHDELQALQALQKLEAAGWGVLRREIAESVHEGWWVYVPNVDASRQARTLRNLQAAGIRDAFAMPNDPEFRVSIGIFADENRAEDRAARVQRLKLDALVSERQREQVVVWFDVPGVARETLSDGRLATAGIVLDKLRVEDCPVAAPATPVEAPSAPTTAIIPAP
jgi:hypothetical protein